MDQTPKHELKLFTLLCVSRKTHKRKRFQSWYKKFLRYHTKISDKGKKIQRLHFIKSKIFILQKAPFIK